MSADVRSASPTLAKYEGLRAAQENMLKMTRMGLHVFNPAWQQVKDSRALGPRYSATFRDTTVTIFGTSKSMTFPVQTCTRVKDLREALAQSTMVGPEEITFLVKHGCSTRKQFDHEELGRSVVVKGISDFKPAPMKWPHLVGVIGAGYNGIKVCMEYLKSGNNNLVVFDRNDKVGGYCWITAANRYSKLQTEMGSFHVWWGPGYGNRKECGGFPTAWEAWPGKLRILEHFHQAAEEYGMLPHVHFRANVADLDVVGPKDDPGRHYRLTASPLERGREEYSVTCSVLYNYPGSMTKNRIIEYPGEDAFDGHIGYGMNDDMPYDQIRGSRVAILGNGAFAVENVRTCIEHQCTMCSVVTRRKNLPSPRIPCWFVHQGPLPTPGRLVLDMFKPMFDITPTMGDPWSYWSVHAPADRRTANIIQNSRFGIGDVTFLALIYGKMEYVESTVKRLTHHTVHLNDGQKLEETTVLVKSLGLIGDFEVDRLHKMKELKGMWIEGDFRRIVAIDPTGMNAANFTTFSTGIGTAGQVLQNKYLHDFPKEYYMMVGQGLLQALPKQKADEKMERPAYVTDVKYQMSAGIIVDSMCPRTAVLQNDFAPYKHEMYHRCHPTDKILKEATADWDKYQREWKAQGAVHDYVPYPYNRENIAEFFQWYNDALGPTTGVSISIDGPDVIRQPPGAAGGDGAAAAAPEASEAELAGIEGWVDAQHKDFWMSEGPKRKAMFVKNAQPAS